MYRLLSTFCSVPFLNLSKISSPWNPTAPGTHPAAPPSGTATPTAILPVHMPAHLAAPVTETAVANGALQAKDDRLKIPDNVSVTSNEDDYDEKSGDPNDAEGVWSPDIEQSFHEAMAIYPPCGRRKIILSDEGKMYGRNELIARYIKLRTGKCRTRKQVSSHIQVLARRKLREMQAKVKHTASPLASLQEHAAKEKVLHSVAAMSSAQIVSAGGMHHKSLPGFGLAPPGAGGVPGTPGSAVTSCYPSHGAMTGPFWQPALHGVSTPQDVKPFSQHSYGLSPISSKMPGVGLAASSTASSIASSVTATAGACDMSLLTHSQPPPPPIWEGRSIATPTLRLVEFSAFMEAPPTAASSASSVHEHELQQQQHQQQHLFVHIGVASAHEPLETISITQIYDKFPEKKDGLRELYDKGPSNSFFLVKFWADLNTTIQDGSGAFYGVTSQYESPENMTITCSTKVCSFGKQVVEKVETEYARLENGRFIYCINRSPMCEYMVNFIHKLKHLPEKYMMNSVLENFTILQVVTNRDTQETLLCIAFVFEVSTSEHGAQHHIYRLVKD